MSQRRSGVSPQTIRAFLRGARERGPGALNAALGSYREALSPFHFPWLVDALLAVAPIEARRFLPYKVSNEAQLLARPPYRIGRADAQLLWAASILRRKERDVNAHLEAKDRLVDALLAGDGTGTHAAISLLEDTAGKSIFGVEQRLAALQLFGGTQAQKDYLAEIRASAPNYFITLLAFFASERNEEQTTMGGTARRVNQWLEESQVPPQYHGYIKLHATALLPNTREDWAEILALESVAGVSDLYEAVVLFIAVIACIDGLGDLHRVALAAIQLLDGARDERLELLRVHLAPNAPYRLRNPGRAAAGLVDLEHIRNLALSPNEPNVTGAGLLPRIVTDLRNVYLRREQRGTSFDRLLKCAANHRGTLVGEALLFTAMRHAAVYDQAYALPRLTLLGLRAPKAIAALCAPAVHQKTVESLLHQALSGVSGVSAASRSIPSSLMKLNLALRAIENGDFARCYELCDELEQKGAYWASEGRRARFQSKIAEGKPSEAIQLAADWIASSEDEYVALEMDLARSVAGRRWADLRHYDAVSLAICIYGLSSSDEVDRFNLMQCVRVADRSGLRTRLDEADALDAKSLFFFRNIWCSPNLDLLVRIGDTKALSHERMAVCRQLVTKDPPRAQRYLTEIKDITFDLALAEGVQQVDQSRVYVDQDGLRRWAEKELKEDFNRYVELASLHPSLGEQERARMRLSAEEGANIPEELFAIPTTDADILLSQLLLRLKDQFLRDPKFGLDSFLSLRVRHGTLAGTLRGPFDEEGLLCIRDEALARYVLPPRWTNAFPVIEVTDALESALAEFTEGFEAALNDTARNRLQINGPEKPLGLIRLEVPVLIVNSMKIDLEGDRRLDRLVTTALEQFGTLLEGSLVTVRRYFTSQLRPHIHSLEQRLRAAVRETVDPAYQASVIGALNRASTELSAVITKVTRWFECSANKDQSRTFDFEEALAISVTTVRNARRDFYPGIDASFDPNLPRIAGRSLPLIVDIFFIALDNVWKHSGLVHEFPIKVTVGMEEASLLVVEMRNQLGPEVDHATVRSRLDSIRNLLSADSKEASRLQTSEGGTGLVKLAKIVAASERPGAAGRVEFGLTDAGEFTVTVRLPMRILRLTEEAADEDTLG